MPKTKAELMRESRARRKEGGLDDYRYYPGIWPELKSKIDKYIDRLMKRKRQG